MGKFALWRRILLYVVVAAMTAVIILMLISYLAHRQFGREIIKINKAGEPVTFADLHKNQSSIPVTQDANSFYFEALRQIRPEELNNFKQINLFYRVNLAALPANQFPADLHDKVSKSLDRAQPVLANIDKAAAFEQSVFDIGITYGSQVARGRLDCAQGAVFLVSLRTLDLIRSNQADKAADSITSSLKLLRVFDSYPTMLVQGRKLTCAGTICSDIQLLLVRCKPSDKRIEKLQSVLEESFPSDTLTTMLLAERIYQLEIARNLIPKGIVSKYLAADIPALPERLELPDFTWHRMRMFIRSVSYMRDIARLIAISRMSWPGPLDELTEPKSKPVRLVSTVALLSRLTADTLATVHCATAAVAIERYQRQEKKFPDSINDISPKYIKSIPSDPYTGKPLLLVSDESGYSVYSAGSNRIDDGGAITPKQDQTTVLDIGIRIKTAPSK